MGVVDLFFLILRASCKTTVIVPALVGIYMAVLLIYLNPCPGIEFVFPVDCHFMSLTSSYGYYESRKENERKDNKEDTEANIVLRSVSFFQSDESAVGNLGGCLLSFLFRDMIDIENLAPRMKGKIH